MEGVEHHDDRIRLGDVGVATNLKITGELRRPKIEGETKLEAARLEVDKLLALFYDPYSVSAMPEVTAADRSVASSAGAEASTRQAIGFWN